MNHNNSYDFISSNIIRRAIIEEHEISNTIPKLILILKSLRSTSNRMFGFSMWLFISSIYALGGVWFRKSAFPIVSAIMFFGTIALGYTLKSMRVSNVEVDVSSTFVSICLILMALVIFYIGYLLFKRFQLITSKWTNL